LLVYPISRSVTTRSGDAQRAAAAAHLTGIVDGAGLHGLVDQSAGATAAVASRQNTAPERCACHGRNPSPPGGADGPRLAPHPIMTDAIGWASSLILVVTIAQQVLKQWREGSSEGVSRWLFLGQMTASAGFTLYSWLVHNWVFVVTNSLLLLNGLAGYLIVLRHRRRTRRAPSAHHAGDAHAHQAGR
jgi:MtN3 and saliva related transmembrane protein